jgi:hypothetical protein
VLERAAAPEASNAGPVGINAADAASALTLAGAPGYDGLGRRLVVPKLSKARPRAPGGSLRSAAQPV